MHVVIHVYRDLIYDSLTIFQSIETRDLGLVKSEVTL